VTDTTKVKQTAAEKIMETIKEISKPKDDAGGLELAFGSVAMMLENALPDALAEAEANGDLDGIVLAFTRWLAQHRGDDARRLLVMELPRGQHLPNGTKLHYFELAEQETQSLPAGLPV
jgi:hypothetical protein